MFCKKLTRFEEACQFGTPGGYYFVNVMATHLVTAEKKISEGAIVEAARFWVKRQPMLLAHVQRINGQNCFVANKDFQFDNIEFVENATDPEGWREILESELTKQFDEPGKMWRLKCIKHKNQYVFLFIVLHSLFDSTSSNHLLIGFLNILGSLISSGHCSEMTGQLEICAENFEELIAKQANSKDFKSKIASTAGVVGNEFPASFGKPDAEVGDLRVEMFLVERARADRLLRAAKKNGSAKMNSVFIAAISLALKRLIVASQAADQTTLLYETAINARKFFELDDGQLACYVTCLFETFQLDELSLDSFWSIAEKKSNHLHMLLEDVEEIGKMYHDVVDSLQTTEDGLFEKQVNFCTSNLGVLKNATGPVKVDKQYLIAKVPTNYGMYFSVVTIDGEQHWTLVHYQKLVSTATARIFVKEFSQVIDDLIKDF